MGNRTWGAVLAPIGLAAAVGGLVAGLTAVYVAGESCGSVLSPEGHRGSSVAAYYVQFACQDELSGRSALMWTLLVLGLAALVAGLVLLVRPSVATERPSDASVGAEQTENEPAQP